MGLLSSIGNYVDSIHQKQDAAKIKDVLTQHNYLTDPTQSTDAVNGVYAIDPDKGAALSQQIAARNTAQSSTGASHYAAVNQYVRGMVDKGADPGQAFDSIAPILKGMGYQDGELGNYRSALVANPNSVYGTDAKYAENSDKAMFDRKVVKPGDHLFQGSQDIGSVAPEIKAVSTPAGGVTNAFNPATGQFGGAALAPGLAVPGGTSGGGGKLGKVTADQLLSAAVPVESGGNYAARNPDTGAMGKYQVMPPTAASLAKRVGVAWRPDLMTSDTPAGHQYQDAIGKAAAQEAVDKTDNAYDAAQYYHGGSNRGIWKEKTRAYADKVTANLGGGQSGPATSVMDHPPVQAAPGQPQSGAGTVMGPPKVSTAAGKPQFRPMTPQELKGYGMPDGSSGQIDSNGQVKILNKPTGAQQSATDNMGRARDAAVSGIDNIVQTLSRLRDDPALGDSLGLTGSVLGHLPGSHKKYVEGQIAQVNAGKLQSVLAAARADGNIFGNRILKSEVDILPKLLGDFNTGQNENDFRSNINNALAQLNSMRSRLTAPAHGQGAGAQNGGVSVGTVQHSPSTGRTRVMTQNGWQEK